MTAGILEGIRVLDLSSHVSGPFCAKLLADYGAEVIKVEAPDSGDVSRRSGPFVGDDPHPDKSLQFLYLNSNKRGITLNLASGSGRAILDLLLQHSDVLVENFSPMESENLSLDYPTLAQVNPALVVTSITPFGRSGPYRDFSATDIITCAMSGLMYHSGDSDREPLRNALDQSFYVSGANAAAATLAALFQRMATGEGQQVEVSVVECLASHLVQAVPYYTYMGAIKGRRPVRGSGFEELMPAKDGYVVMAGVKTEERMQALWQLTGREDLLQDPRYLGQGADGDFYFQNVIPAIEGWSQKFSRHEVTELLTKIGFSMGVSQTISDLADCPHLEARGMYAETGDTKGGVFRTLKAPIRLPGCVETPTQTPPQLGEHNQAILCGIGGLSLETLVELQTQGVI